MTAPSVHAFPGLDPAPAEVEPAPPTLADRILRRHQLAELPKPVPLIADTLEQRTVVALAGRNSTGKSFVALDWACCIATGKPWQGRPIARTGPVLYVAAEGAFGLDQRVTSWETGWKQRADDLHVYPKPLNLFTGQDVPQLEDVVRERGYVLVVFDTWSRSTVGGKENDNSDTTKATNHAALLTDLGATVLVVAHTDAGDTKVRGATALEDNVDTVYRMKGDARLLTLERTKRKDGPMDDRLNLRLKVIGESCVVENVRPTEADMAPRAAELMSAFMSAYGDVGATKTELRSTADQPPATFARSVKALLTTGALVNIGTDQRPFYKPGDGVTR